jgi:hypothetical protein
MSRGLEKSSPVEHLSYDLGPPQDARENPPIGTQR